MSIQAVAWALEQTIPDPAAKLVLIALCNAYNGKSGRCDPAIGRLVHESSCSKSTVLRKLAFLADEGWITTIPEHDEAGRQKSNVYYLDFESDRGEGVNLTPRGVKTGEGVNCDTGEGVNCDTPLKEPEYIPEDIILSARARETEIPVSKTKPTPRDELRSILDEKHAQAVIEHRIRLRKPLTAHAAGLLAKRFSACPDPNAAADEMIANGWQGFNVKWIENRDGPARNHGPPGKHFNQGMLDAFAEIAAGNTAK